MLKTSTMLTITVPKKTAQRIRQEAIKRSFTISGLLRTAFDQFTLEAPEPYTAIELKQLLTRDRLSPRIRRELDTLLQ